MMYGHVNGKRCDFVRERLVDVEFRRKPDLDKYMDGYGYRRDVTSDMATEPKERKREQRDAYLNYAGALGAAHYPMSVRGMGAGAFAVP
jgi:hypothetical protein